MGYQHLGGRCISRFQGSLFYIVGFKIVKAIYRNPVSKKKNQTKPTNKKTRADWSLSLSDPYGGRTDSYKLPSDLHTLATPLPNLKKIISCIHLGRFVTFFSEVYK